MVDLADKVATLKREIDHLADKYRHDRHRHKRAGLQLKLATVAFSSLAAVCIGLTVDEPWATVLQNLALILSVGTALITAWESYYNPKQLWIQETVFYCRLQDLSRDIDYYTAGRTPNEYDPAAIDTFKARLDQILDHNLEDWAKMKQDE